MVFQPPHLRSAHVQVFKSKLHRVKGHFNNTDNVNIDIRKCPKLECCCYTLLHTDCIWKYYEKSLPIIISCKRRHGQTACYH